MAHREEDREPVRRHAGDHPRGAAGAHVRAAAGAARLRHRGRGGRRRADWRDHRRRVLRLDPRAHLEQRQGGAGARLASGAWRSRQLGRDQTAPPVVTDGDHITITVGHLHSVCVGGDMRRRHGGR